MHVLFAISILALVALLLASAAIVRHVRRSRRRRRRFLEENAAGNSAGTVHEVNFSEGQRFDSTPRAAVFEPEPETAPPPPFPTAAAAIHSSVSAGFPATASMLEPETVALAAALEAATQSAAVDSLHLQRAPADAGLISNKNAANADASVSSEPEVTPEPAPEAAALPDSTDQPETKNMGAELAPAPEVTSSIAPQPEQPREPPFSTAARQLAAGLQLSNATAPAADISSEPATDPQRSSRISSAKHLLSQLVPPLERPDWAYFNKDMGDLSDPEAPRSRLRGNRAIKQRHKPA